MIDLKIRKKTLKEGIVESNFETVVLSIKEILQEDSAHFNEIILLSERYKICQKEKVLGTRTHREIETTYNSLVFSLLELIDGLKDADLKNSITEPNVFNSKTSLLLFDIDGFTSINNFFGKETGDLILKTLNELFKKELQNSNLHIIDSDWLFTDEFYIICHDSAAVLKEFALKVIDLVKTMHWQKMKAELFVTLSAGLCDIEFKEDIEHAFVRAYIGMRDAKFTGRNSICYGPKHLPQHIPLHVTSYSSGSYDGTWLFDGTYLRGQEANHRRISFYMAYLSQYIWNEKFSPLAGTWESEFNLQIWDESSRKIKNLPLVIKVEYINDDFFFSSSSLLTGTSSLEISGIFIITGDMVKEKTICLDIKTPQLVVNEDAINGYVNELNEVLSVSAGKTYLKMVTANKDLHFKRKYSYSTRYGASY